MKKIKFLKTSYLKNIIKDFILKICLLDFKFYTYNLNKKNKNNKILIVSIDSLGDNVVKSRTFEIFAKEFGKENIYILCQGKWKVIYELQGYNNLFLDEKNWNIFYKIKLYRKLNKMNFSKMIVFDHPGYPYVLNYLFIKEKYEAKGEVNYILEKHIILLKKVFDKDFSLEDVRPHFENYLAKPKQKNIICVGIGASGNDRIMKIETMRKILLGLSDTFFDKNIVLIGMGKREKKYTTELLKGIERKNIINSVNKFILKEMIEIINNSEFYIGGDSGPMNVAFSLNKKVVCTHWSKEKYIWEHSFKNIKIIKGVGGKRYRDEKYGTEILNSITFEQVKKAIEELGIL